MSRSTFSRVGAGRIPAESMATDTALVPPTRLRSGDLFGPPGGRLAVPGASESEIAGHSLIIPPDALNGLPVVVTLDPADSFIEGDDVAIVSPDDLIAFTTAVRDAGYAMFVDLCGVDHLTRAPRFEVVINLVSLSDRSRLRILVGVDGADPVVPSITAVYPGANFYERETWDLLGIRFDGHPDLTRILLPDEWEGHPLRKDSPVGSIPVQFKEANKAT